VSGSELSRVLTLFEEAKFAVGFITDGTSDFDRKPGEKPLTSFLENDVFEVGK